MPTLTYLPLDLKGNKPSNRIIGEQRTLVKVANRPNRVLLPRLGAFYANSVLRLQANGQVLVPGRDYTSTYLYSDLSKLTTLPVYALIVVTNPEVSDTVVLDYQAVGGAFGLDVDELSVLLEAVRGDDLRVNYEDIINRPKAFNPAEHMDHYWQLYGAENTITVIHRTSQLVTTRDTSQLANMQEYAETYRDMAAAKVAEQRDLFNIHLADHNNPHDDDKVDVGLSHLHNWPMASTDAHLIRSVDFQYAQPGGGLAAIEAGPAVSLREHILRRDNPHGIRAGDVNAYSTDEQNSLYDTKLNRWDAAYDADTIYDYTAAGFKAYAMTNIPAHLVTHGYFGNAQLGVGYAGSDTFLMGDGTWRSMASMAQQHSGEARMAANHVMMDNSSMEPTMYNVVNFVDTTYVDPNTFPVGTELTVTMTHTDDIFPLVKTEDGWSKFIP